MYHHINDQSGFFHFERQRRPFAFYLYYAREHAFHFYHPEFGLQLIPEGHLQVYYVSPAPPRPECKTLGKFSLLAINFSSSLLEPLCSQSLQVMTFLDSAKKGVSSKLFRVPQQSTIENRILLNDVEAHSWSADHLSHMIRLILERSLRAVATDYLPSATIADVLNDHVYAVAEWILLHVDEPVSLPVLAQKFLVNEFKLKADFKRLFGVPVITFQRRARIEKAKKLLSRTGTAIYEIAHQVGFMQTAYFSDFFRRETGMSPSDFRRRLTVNEIFS